MATPRPALLHLDTTAWRAHTRTPGAPSKLVRMQPTPAQHAWPRHPLCHWQRAYPGPWQEGAKRDTETHTTFCSRGQCPAPAHTAPTVSRHAPLTSQPHRRTACKKKPRGSESPGKPRGNQNWGRDELASTHQQVGSRLHNAWRLLNERDRVADGPAASSSHKSPPHTRVTQCRLAGPYQRVYGYQGHCKSGRSTSSTQAQPPSTLTHNTHTHGKCTAADSLARMQSMGPGLHAANTCASAESRLRHTIKATAAAWLHSRMHACCTRTHTLQWPRHPATPVLLLANKQPTAQTAQHSTAEQGTQQLRQHPALDGVNNMSGRGYEHTERTTMRHPQRTKSGSRDCFAVL